MGTLNYTLGRYARTRGNAAATLMSSDIRTSDAFTTTTSAANVEDGSGDITAAAGDVLMAVASEPMWIAFGNGTATVGNDFYMAADVTYWWEVETAGTISVIDVS